MHGRKRTEYKHRFQDPQVAAGLAQKAQQWYTLSDKALALRQDPSKAEMTLPLLDKMLRVNPDPLHLWNMRRELLPKAPENWLPTELSLTAAGLERNPKAYGAWFHRKWVLQQQQQQNADREAMATLLAQELALTDLFLQRDERNFHCWNFRRFLVGLELQMYTSGDGGNGDGSWMLAMMDNEEHALVIGPQITGTTSTTSSTTTNNDKNKEKVESILQREWDFTQCKIVANFSNFSAFHYRSKLLLLTSYDDDGNAKGWTPKVASNDTKTLQAMARQEWSLMESIMFTEPDDQTIWWYHRFVLDWLVQEQQSSDGSNENDWYVPWLQQQAETLQALAEEDEDGCKWGLLGWHLVLSRLAQAPCEDEEKSQQKQQMETILDKLIRVDPDRTQRYQIMKKQQQQQQQQ